MKKNKYLLGLIGAMALYLILSFTSCSDDDLLPENASPELTTKTEVAVSSPVTNERNLNVIYFVPTDNPEVSGYEDRLSDLLIYFQDWIKDEMSRNGYGNKTFGLSLNPTNGKVKIITIKAKEDQAAYGDNSTGKIISEINKYKAEHPDDFSNTRHSLIILPRRTDGGSQPFFGFIDGSMRGKCFAADNPNMKVSEIPITKSNLIGGMIHELGHGLGLPHNSAKVSEKSTLGTALMGLGNHTFGRKPTFLTAADAAILDRCEIFQTTVPSDILYYTKGKYTVDAKLSYDVSSRKIIVEGTYSSSIPVTKALLWLDPNTGTNKDYNSVVWPVDVNANTIYGEIPIDELPIKKSTMYEFKIRLLQNNGVLLETILYFNFLNNEVIDPANSVLVFQQCNYKGYWYSLVKGNYTTQDLINLGISDNDISSVRPAGGYKITLYDGDNFTGESYSTVTKVSCQFDDKTSSLKVEKID